MMVLSNGINRISVLLSLVGTVLFASAALSSPTEQLKPVGEARLKVYFWNVYDSTLYTANGDYAPQQTPLALKIQYLREIDSDDLVTRTKEEWQNLGVNAEKIKQWLPELAQIFPDIKKSDTLLLHIDNQQVSHFLFNDKLIGKVSDPQFGNAFVRIWLDENCSYPKMCKKLRGDEPQSN